MKIINFNKDNLKKNEIHKTSIRVKAFIVNSNNEILIATSNGGCQLPGGHIEKNEKLIDGIIREVQEETGIVLNKNEIGNAFYEINHYTKNYKNTNTNRLSSIMYFVIKTNKKPNLNNLNLTEQEKQNKFSVSYVHKDNFISYVNNYLNNAELEINKVIAKELLMAYEYFLNIKKVEE